MANGSPAETSSIYDDALRLQVWAYPIVFAQRLRLRFTSPLNPHARRPPTSAGAALNSMGHQRRLSDHTLTAGVAPNVDTLYSLAFVDLDAGTFKLELPDFADRYYCVQIGEADSTTNTVFGSRTHGSQSPPKVLRRFRHHTGRADTSVEFVDCLSRYVMVAVRILVDPSSTADLAHVHDLQDRITLTGPTSEQSLHDGEAHLLTRDRTQEMLLPSAFLDSTEYALAALSCEDIPNWVTVAHARLLVALNSPDHNHSFVQQQFKDGLQAGLDRVREHVRWIGTMVNGWAINHMGSDFGEDDLLRAAVAYAQIYINPAEEALYPVCEQDSDGVLLSGTARYKITFSQRELPPAQYFWSMTMYHARGLLYGNEINRYAITDRTRALCWGSDGSLTIHIQTERPPAGIETNWLPCPPGDFRLMLRLYGPKTADWVPPPVHRVAGPA